MQFMNIYPPLYPITAAVTDDGNDKSFNINCTNDECSILIYIPCMME